MSKIIDFIFSVLFLASIAWLLSRAVFEILH